MKAVIILIVVGLISIVVFFIYNSQSEVNTKQPISSPAPSKTIDIPKKVDHKASFAIYTNGTLRIFIDARYHNLSKDVYLAANNPNVVNIKKAQVTWGDFFNTLPMKLTKDCLTTGTGQVFCSGSEGVLEFYLNGIKTEDALSMVINDGDKLLVTFGNSSENIIKKQIETIPDN